MDILQRLQVAAQRLNQADEELAKATAHLEAVKEARRHLAEDIIPTMMAEANLPYLPLPDGRKLVIDEILTAAIDKESPQQAFDWLIANDGAGLIKTQVNINFERGSAIAAQWAAGCLALLFPDLAIECGQKVHPQTLNAFLRERVKNGLPVDMAALNVSVFERAKLKG